MPLYVKMVNGVPRIVEAPNPNTPMQAGQSPAVAPPMSRNQQNMMTPEGRYGTMQETPMSQRMMQGAMDFAVGGDPRTQPLINTLMGVGGFMAGGGGKGGATWRVIEKNGKPMYQFILGKLGAIAETSNYDEMVKAVQKYNLGLSKSTRGVGGMMYREGYSPTVGNVELSPQQQKEGMAMIDRLLGRSVE